jgi:hypothetical protein
LSLITTAILASIVVLSLDGKSKDLLTMKQDEREWMEYENITKEVSLSSGLDERIFYDLRGNHDSFGVPMQGAINDFYEKYSINSRLRRNGNVQSVTLKVSIYVYFTRIAFVHDM